MEYCVAGNLFVFCKKLYTKSKIIIVSTFILINPRNFKPMKFPAIYTPYIYILWYFSDIAKSIGTRCMSLIIEFFIDYISFIEAIGYFLC